MRSTTRTTIKIRKYESTVLRRSLVNNPDEDAGPVNEAESVEFRELNEFDTNKPPELPESSLIEESE